MVNFEKGMYKNR